MQKLVHFISIAVGTFWGLLLNLQNAKTISYDLSVQIGMFVHM